MRICVITGGTGGIGLHLCEGFQRAGYAVTALDVEQHKALPDGIGFIQTDLRQAEAVSNRRTYSSLLRSGCVDRSLSQGIVSLLKCRSCRFLYRNLTSFSY